MPPNGITVLEHALVMFMSAECVDVIAKRVRPRRALWIAAGLGDVAGVRSFIAGTRTLTPDGRLDRPDPMATGWFVGLPPNLEADDLEIMWEAFLIAGLNDRWATMDALLDAGLPVDHRGNPTISSPSSTRRGNRLLRQSRGRCARCSSPRMTRHARVSRS